MKVGTFAATFIFAVCLIPSLMTSRVLAEVSILANLTPNPHLPGYWLMNFTAQSDVPTEQIVGFDFGRREDETPESALGFFGAMSQVYPLGNPSFSTVYQDNNTLLTGLGEHFERDSQFKFSTLNVVAAPQNSFEDLFTLQGTFGFQDPQGLSVTFAQVVARGNISYRGDVYVERGGIAVPIRIEGGVYDVPLLPEPEPTSALLVCAAGGCGLAFLRVRAARS